MRSFYYDLRFRSVTMMVEQTTTISVTTGRINVIFTTIIIDLIIMMVVDIICGGFGSVFREGRVKGGEFGTEEGGSG